MVKSLVSRVIVAAGLPICCTVNPGDDLRAAGLLNSENTVIPYCDMIFKPALYDGKTVIIDGILIIVLNSQGGWMYGFDCQNDASSAAAFSRSKSADEYFDKNSWLVTGNTDPVFFRVKARARFLNSSPDRSTNQLANYQVLIEEVIESEPINPELLRRL